MSDDFADEKLLALPGRRRAQIVQTLLKSLGDEPEHVVAKSWVVELEKRAHEALTDESCLEEWADVRASVVERLRTRKE